MAPVRLLPREVWEERLRREGCRPCDHPSRLATAEAWQNEQGKIFLVPMDNGEGMLRTDDLQQVLVQVAKIRPLDI
ncbi:MAG: hypothetical protein K2Z80_12275 [Xanthobacteraceae bacterium]|nr:hypothetical protein [Xanthobacteraceae bacterium]